MNITLNLNLDDLARSFLLNEGLSNLTILSYVETSNEDLNQKNNMHNNTIHLIAKADMKING